MINKKVLIICAIIAIAIVPCRCLAYETGDVVDITPIMEEALNGIDLTSWQNFISDNEFFSSIANNNGGITQYIKNLINGEAAMSFDSFFNTVFADFIASLKSHMSIAGILFGLALICAVLDKISKSMFKGSISAVASNVLFCCAVGLIIKGFSNIIASGVGCVNNMSDFIEKSLPVLMALVTTAGGAAASQMLQPNVLMTLELTTKLINCVIIPLLTASSALSIAYHICLRKPYAEISGSVKKLADWIIGIMFTLFFGFISIQKLTSSALDGISVKTIKYTLSSFSLYGGSFLSKSFDIVTGCAVMMKNVLGGVGMIILLCICVSPALELLAISIVYRISSLLISLTGETRISGCLNDVGKIYGTLFLCVMTSAILFFMLLSVITVAGNMTLGI